jgi:hypothetical protein
MPLGTNTTIAYVSPPLECVICIQSSKQELKNSDVVVETPKEISPLVIVPNVHLRQVSDVSTMMPPSKKTNLPTPTSYVEELWESLNVKKSPLGIVDAEKVDKMGARAKHVEDLGARSCNNVENKDLATMDVNVFYGEGNEKGRKRLKKIGIKALAAYATKQGR